MSRPRSPLFVLFLTVFIDLVGFGIVIPILPLYAEHFHASPLAMLIRSRPEAMTRVSGARSRSGAAVHVRGERGDPG